MQTIQFISITPEQLQDSIIKGVKIQLDELKKTFAPKEPTEFVTRNYVANEMLHCNISTVHNLTVRGVLIKYGIGGRVLYKRAEVESAIVELRG